MKERVTLTIEKQLLHLIDSKVDGNHIKNRSHAVELFLRKALKGAAPETALILAGGKGTRLGTQTKMTPKALIEVAGKPVLQHNIDLCNRHGIKHIIISLGHLAEQVEEYLKEHPQENITIVKEEQPLGTAGPLRLVKDMLQETFVLLNGDELKDINIGKLYKAHIEGEALITIALTTKEDVSAFGVALMDGHNIVSFVEKPKKGQEPSNLISAGLYIVEPEVISLVPQGFAMVEYDVFPKVAKKGKLAGYPFSGQWLAIDTPERLADARKNWKGFRA